MSSSLVPSATATIEQLHRDGYAVIEDVLDPATCATCAIASRACCATSASTPSTRAPIAST